jgi:type VI secretion system protein ImpK
MGATLFGSSSIKPPEQPASRRKDNLGLVFQNQLTVIVRLRGNKQVTNDAQAFRQQMKNGLQAAEREAVGKLYPPEDVRLAIFAVVAFLDESVLNSSNAAFSDWVRMPLQEEMYGHHRAGEVFFEYIERLLSRPDSNGVADLLEVYLLCLLLGYKGKYGIDLPETGRPILDSISNKIQRIRGPLQGLSIGWAIPEGSLRAATQDPWIRRLAMTAFFLVFLALASFAVYRIMLRVGTADLGVIISLVNW